MERSNLRDYLFILKSSNAFDILLKSLGPFLFKCMNGWLHVYFVNEINEVTFNCRLDNKLYRNYFNDITY